MKALKQMNNVEKRKSIADRSFDGNLTLYAIEPIVKYTEREKMDTTFCHMVTALFNPS